MDVSAFNYDSSATDNDGSCIAVVLGCTSSGAFNYDPNANTDNGDCCYVSGCTDSQHLTITLMHVSMMVRV